MTQARQQKILIVEDDAGICDLLKMTCRFAGFEPVTTLDRDVIAAEINGGDVDICIMDLGLPGDDGISIIHRIREYSDIPILILTGRSSVNERVRGLEAGADDYMIKPFAGIELIARIKTIMRRTGKAVDKRERDFTQIYLEKAVFDVATGEIVIGKTSISLTEKEQLLLVAMVRGGGMIDRQAAYEIVFRKPWQPGDRQLDVHISNLRRKLAKLFGENETIRSIRGLGYELAMTFRMD